MTLTAYNRASSLNALLKDHGLSQAVISFLAGDASPRKYYRVAHSQDTFVLMDTPASEKPEQFIKVANLLTENGFSAPQIIGQNLDEGYILLEDLKDATFTKVINSDPSQAPMLYSLATETLLALTKSFHCKPDFIEDYTQRQFMEGVLLFADWCFPACHGYELSEKARIEFEQIWLKIFKKIDRLPKTLMLRDFHVDNLVHLKDRSGTQACGLLDFQDARWGPMVYDFISLIDDVRVNLSPDIEAACWDTYTQAFPLFKEGTPERALAHMLSTSRITRILGVFTRLARRDGKRHYLTYMLHVWQLLDKNLKYPELAKLQQWFEQHVTNREIIA